MATPQCSRYDSHTYQRQDKLYSYEEALSLTGIGRYNWWLFLVSLTSLLSMGLDLFSVNVLVTTETCDLDLSLPHKSIIKSAPLAGFIIMSYVWGYVSDTEGRRYTLILSLFGGFVFAMLSSLAPNWICMALCKLIGGGFSSGCSTSAYTLLGESSPKEVRAKYMLLVGTPLLGCVTFYTLVTYAVLMADFSFYLPLVGFFRPWRLAIQVQACLLLISGVMALYVFESPKFLANAGKHNEALRILRSIHATNRTGTEYPVVYFVLENLKVLPEAGSIILHTWNLTKPIFNSRNIKNTLTLFYLTIIMFSTYNSFTMWLPFLVNAFSKHEIQGNLCMLLREERRTVLKMMSLNSSLTGTVRCNDTLENSTIWTGLIMGVATIMLCILISWFANRRKLITIVVLTACSMSGACVNLTFNPLLSLIFFNILVFTNVLFGVTSIYFLDLYPTTNTATASCLGMLLARVSSVFGGNLVGAVIGDHCEVTFYGWSIFVLSGVAAACFLPSDKKNHVEASD